MMTHHCWKASSCALVGHFASHAMIACSSGSTALDSWNQRPGADHNIGPAQVSGARPSLTEDLRWKLTIIVFTPEKNPRTQFFLSESIVICINYGESDNSGAKVGQNFIQQLSLCRRWFSCLEGKLILNSRIVGEKYNFQTWTRLYGERLWIKRWCPFLQIHANLAEIFFHSVDPKLFHPIDVFENILSLSFANIMVKDGMSLHSMWYDLRSWTIIRDVMYRAFAKTFF